MSFRPDSAMARRMLRRMRPNPLIPTRTVILLLLEFLFRHARPCAGHPRLPSLLDKTWMAGTSPAMTACENVASRLVSSSSEPAQRRLGDLLGRNAEVPVQVLVGRTGAETVHADEHAVRADDRVPALAHRGLDRDVDLGAADHRLA